MFRAVHSIQRHVLVPILSSTVQTMHYYTTTSILTGKASPPHDSGEPQHKRPWQAFGPCTASVAARAPPPSGYPLSRLPYRRRRRFRFLFFFPPDFIFLRIKAIPPRCPFDVVEMTARWIARLLSGTTESYDFVLSHWDVRGFLNRSFPFPYFCEFYLRPKHDIYHLPHEHGKTQLPSRGRCF